MKAQTQTRQGSQTKTPKTQNQTQKIQKPVDPDKYNTLMDLKFIQLGGGVLKDEKKKEMDQLEKEIRQCKGKRPIMTVRAAIGNEQILLWDSIPVPDSIYQIIKNANSTEYYFGK